MKPDWSQRLQDVRHFYKLLEQLEAKCGSKRLLSDCHGQMNWPLRGVYFFFEPGEARNNSGDGPRVVRVGTHAIDKPDNQQKLWDRLRTHRGPLSGKYANGGNHRASVFRKHIGYAIIARDQYTETEVKWGQGNSAPEFIRKKEHLIELAVSQLIRMMPFLWLPINDAPSPGSLRNYIERNAIAMLSNYSQYESRIDEPSENWLGNWAKSDYVRYSGMWNVDHVDDNYDTDFLNVFAEIIYECKCE
jgi:hypothetical protein